MATEAYVQPIKARRDLGAIASRALGLLLVVLVLVWLGVNLVKTPDDFGRVLLIGVSQGALYALVALGYTLVYGILELINFAHGDVFMIGGMISATIALQGFGISALSSPPLGTLIAAMLVSLVASMLGCGLLNVAIERIAYKPLRGAPRLARRFRTHRAALVQRARHRRRGNVRPPRDLADVQLPLSIFFHFVR